MLLCYLLTNSLVNHILDSRFVCFPMHQFQMRVVCFNKDQLIFFLSISEFRNVLTGHQDPYTSLRSYKLTLSVELIDIHKTSIINSLCINSTCKWCVSFKIRAYILPEKVGFEFSFSTIQIFSNFISPRYHKSFIAISVLSLSLYQFSWLSSSLFF